jgi:hypothetical protein
MRAALFQPRAAYHATIHGDIRRRYLSPSQDAAALASAPELFRGYFQAPDMGESSLRRVTTR